MSAIGKPVNPVTAAELEGLSLRVTQACSTIHLIIEACDQLSHVQNALGLLELELDRCAEDSATCTTAARTSRRLGHERREGSA